MKILSQKSFFLVLLTLCSYLCTSLDVQASKRKSILSDSSGDKKNQSKRQKAMNSSSLEVSESALSSDDDMWSWLELPEENKELEASLDASLLSLRSTQKQSFIGQKGPKDQTCPLCNKVIPYERGGSFARHLDKKHADIYESILTSKEKEIKCPVKQCKALITNGWNVKAVLNNHILEHHVKNKRHPCPDCSESFHRLRDFEKHRKKCGGIVRPSAPSMSLNPGSQDSAALSSASSGILLDNQGLRAMSSPLLGASAPALLSSSRSTQKQSLIGQKGPADQTCPLCNKVILFYRGSFFKHLDEKHANIFVSKEERIRCPVKGCNALITNGWNVKAVLENHIEASHVENKRHRCLDCSESFHRRRDFKNHRKRCRSIVRPLAPSVELNSGSQDSAALSSSSSEILSDGQDSLAMSSSSLLSPGGYLPLLKGSLHLRQGFGAQVGEASEGHVSASSLSSRASNSSESGQGISSRVSSLPRVSENLDLFRRVIEGFSKQFAPISQQAQSLSHLPRSNFQGFYDRFLNLRNTMMKSLEKQFGFKNLDSLPPEYKKIYTGCMSQSYFPAYLLLVIRQIQNYHVKIIKEPSNEELIREYKKVKDKILNGEDYRLSLQNQQVESDVSALMQEIRNVEQVLSSRIPAPSSSSSETLLDGQEEGLMSPMFNRSGDALSWGQGLPEENKQSEIDLLLPSSSFDISSNASNGQDLRAMSSSSYQTQLQSFIGQKGPSASGSGLQVSNSITQQPVGLVQDISLYPVLRAPRPAIAVTPKVVASQCLSVSSESLESGRNISSSSLSNQSLDASGFALPPSLSSGVSSSSMSSRVSGSSGALLLAALPSLSSENLDYFRKAIEGFSMQFSSNNSLSSNSDISSLSSGVSSSSMSSGVSSSSGASENLDLFRKAMKKFSGKFAPILEKAKSLSSSNFKKIHHEFLELRGTMMSFLGEQFGFKNLDFLSSNYKEICIEHMSQSYIPTYFLLIIYKIKGYYLAITENPSNEELIRAYKKEKDKILNGKDYKLTSENPQLKKYVCALNQAIDKVDQLLSSMAAPSSSGFDISSNASNGQDLRAMSSSSYQTQLQSVIGQKRPSASGRGLQVSNSLTQQPLGLVQDISLYPVLRAPRAAIAVTPKVVASQYLGVSSESLESGKNISSPSLSNPLLDASGFALPLSLGSGVSSSSMSSEAISLPGVPDNLGLFRGVIENFSGQFAPIFEKAKSLSSSNFKGIYDQFIKLRKMMARSLRAQFGFKNFDSFSPDYKKIYREYMSQSCFPIYFLLTIYKIKDYYLEITQNPFDEDLIQAYRMASSGILNSEDYALSLQEPQLQMYVLALRQEIDKVEQFLSSMPAHASSLSSLEPSAR